MERNRDTDEDDTANDLRQPRGEILEEGVTANVQDDDEESFSTISMLRDEDYVEDYDEDEYRGIWGWHINNLLNAVGSGNIAHVQRELEGGRCNVNSQNGSDTTPLHRASARGHLEMVQFLILNGANSFNVQDENLWTPLHHTCCTSKWEIAKLLMEKGSDKNTTDNLGWTPLHLACGWEGDWKVVKLLIEYGANLDVKNFCERKTPLHFACGYHHFETIKLLVKNGACLHTKDIHGNTALHIACCDEERKSSSNLEVIRFLIEQGAQINAKNNYGWTSLHRASRPGPHSLEVVRLLIAQDGIDVNSKDNRGCTALFMACQYNRLEVGKLLIENGADIDSKDNHYGKTLLDLEYKLGDSKDHGGKTPLHLACKLGHLDFVKLLLSRGADANAKTKDGATPLQVAAERKRHEVVWFLVRQCPWLVSGSLE